MPVKSLSEDLPGAIKSLSALTFLSLLWLSFTLLEAADQALPPQPGSMSSDPEARKEEDDIWVFLRTDMQIALGLCASISWACKSGMSRSARAAELMARSVLEERRPRHRHVQCLRRARAQSVSLRAQVRLMTR